MRYTRIVLTSALALLAAPVPALAETPQQITDKVAQVLVGAPVVHGPNMVLYATRETRPSRPTYIDSDCAGRIQEIDAATQAGLVPPPMPKYGKRVYGRENIATNTCAAPDQYDLFPLASRAIRQFYQHKKKQAMIRACRFVAAAAKKGQPPHQQLHVSCRHLKAVYSDSSQTILQYYGRGRSHAKLASVALTADGRLIRLWRDDSTRTSYNRQLQ